MLHFMTLNEKFFIDSFNKNKLIEFRLNDFKRQSIKIDDVIQFRNRNNPSMFFYVKVTKLLTNNNFEQLINNIDLSLVNYSPNELIHLLNSIYPAKSIDKFGTLAIYFEVI
ncbi:hypothetical protein ACV3OB_04695 [Clostridium perfringens]|uniref:hypothetical protein n=1 Tax=Clostridium perfringens TaxID=1502 RepID=UPI000D508399|nr:hypothetical protein [Clostridium perfringens]EJT6662900.1 hypothetical protein [Clostridium perfringens]MDM0616978.1 hypothetical protein [Clostridium perfringens]MDU4131332.1 hypothetical protein [Clostridium perfringens]MDU6143999.1 hypothetical protein [Clostridium perfringens]PVE17628.1 hypothetical protein DDA98_03285 [Clostridium perfringens]